MNRFEIPSKPLTWLMALVLTAVVAGCGGGGGGGTAAMTTVDGIGAFGKPIIGGSAQMVCANNAAGTAATTIATGAFTVTAPGSAPCVIRISGGNLASGPFYSIFEAGQTRANVNQLTTMLAFLLADGNPETFFTSPGSISTKITAAAVATDKETIRASVIANLAGAVTPAISTSFDFLQTAFTANSTGFDQMLDKLGFASVGNTSASITFNGAPLLAVNPTSNVASTTTSTLITSVTLAAAGASGTAGIPGTVLPGASATNTVGSASPSNLATNVPTSTNNAGTVTGKLLAATFTQAMNPATINSAMAGALSTFTLKETVSGTNVSGTVVMTAGDTVATFTPTTALTPNINFTATITTAAMSAGGIAMANPVAWSFTTGATFTGLAPINLGAAQNFAVIAAAGITNAAFATAITGDMGTQPTVSVTGFPPGTVTGTTFANASAGSTAGLARAAAGTAYQAALIAAAVPGFVTVAGDIGGTTRTPGAYHSTSTLTISTPLTLDAQGDPDAIWIFDMGSTLTTTGGGTVVLSNGAQAKNVFWRVGSSATLGAAIFKGTILADTTIILGTTAIDVAGRLFAGSVTSSGAVNFNTAAHTVVRPAP